MEKADGPVRESRLRAETLLAMLGGAMGPTLLVGESEGVLATLAEKEGRHPVTWVEPAECCGGCAQQTSSRCAGPREGKLVADCSNLPFEDGAFKGVASQFTLDYVENPALALEEWRRVLSVGGSMALVIRNRLYRGPDLPPGPRRLNTFSPGELRALCEEAGLSVRETLTLLPDLKLPALYRGDLGFSRRIARLPYLAARGRLLFVSAVRPGGVSAP